MDEISEAQIPVSRFVHLNYLISNENTGLSDRYYM
jgi:hypothetical protein